MAKGRNQNRGSQAHEEGEASNAENSNKENKANPKGVIELGVYMHCLGCAHDVVKCLRGFDGVEVIETDMKNHKVIVKGKKVDPTRITERLRKKTCKHVELISPLPPKDNKEDKKEHKKEEIQPKVVEVMLKIYLHCEGCAKDVKHCIHKMEGVHTVEPDMKNSHVLVKGVFDPEKLVEFVNKRAGRHAALVKTSKKENKNEETSKKENKNEEERKGDSKKDSMYHNYHPELVYAPQLFSDENPNACGIM